MNWRITPRQRNYKRALEDKEKPSRAHLARRGRAWPLHRPSPPTSCCSGLPQSSCHLGDQDRIALRGQPLVDFIASLEPRETPEGSSRWPVEAE